MRILPAAALIVVAGMASAETRSLTADIWVDNWFTLYVNGEKVVEDSVPITTERSFNAETANLTADLPITIGILAMDFKENDTGLEYIGTNRQQMGDGGLIAQFKDATTGALVAATDGAARCLVVHHAPVDRRCAEESDPVAGEDVCDFETTEIPADWAKPGFDDSSWPMATVHSAADVDPKDGYDRIEWDDAAELIWSEDLLQDNTVLCRMEIPG